MGETNNVFISWSGRRSKAAAEALRKWLPKVLQSAKPWMSETDIEKGSRGLDEVGKALEGMKVGIICLTPENLAERWILYEAGALSKTLDARTRVCTFLLGGLRKRDVKPPLGLFQATEAEQEETRKLVHAVNSALDGSPVAEDDLNDVFDAMWPKLEKQLKALPVEQATAAPKRSVEDMVAELLELNRGGVESIRDGLKQVTEDVGDLSHRLLELDRRTEPLSPLSMARRMQEQEFAEAAPAKTSIGSLLSERDGKGGKGRRLLDNLYGKRSDRTASPLHSGKAKPDDTEK